MEGIPTHRGFPRTEPTVFIPALCYGASVLREEDEMPRLSVAALFCAVAFCAAAQGPVRDSKDHLGFRTAEGLDHLYAKGELTTIAGDIDDS